MNNYFYKGYFMVVLLLATVPTKAQTVPKEMQIGDVKITITEQARRQIQKDVEARTASPTYLNILVDRMNLYFPIIERIFEEYNIPDELKYLAIQESALISDAVSSSNAVGFWQFKDFTGREVGLRVDRQIDERLNITSATIGAAKYLRKNNFFFDNWIYSVMAYNTGPTGAENFTDKSKYGAKKMTIDAKTHWYVKKYLSYVVAFSPHVGKDHSEGIWLDEDFKAGGESFEKLARKHSVNLEELKSYNKWLKRGNVPTDKPVTVLVPKRGKAPKRTQNRKEKTATTDPPPLTRADEAKIEKPEEKPYPKEVVNQVDNESRLTVIPINSIPSVVARSGDDVATLSARLAISEKKFRKYNDMGTSDELRPNEFYYIKKKKSRSKIGYHVTRQGETLWDVAQQYGIKKANLAKMNRMSIIDELKTGRVLWLSKTRPSNTQIAYHTVTNSSSSNTRTAKKEKPLPKKEKNVVEDRIIVTPPLSASERRKVKIHTVAKGETLSGIADIYEIALSDLLRWNELEDPDKISIGQNILVKPPIEEVKAKKKTRTHKVAPGDTLYAISRKYEMTVDELMDLNKLSSSAISIGQELLVFRK